MVAPPGIPADRLAILRRAFIALADDAEFLAEAERQKLEVGPISGEAVDRMVGLIVSAPPEVVARFKTAMGVGGN